MKIDYREKEVREFGKKLRDLRRLRQITQLELSQKIVVSELTVRNWEAGLKTPSMSNLAALARALDVSVDYMLGLQTGRMSEQVLLSQDERHLLVDYRELDKPGKHTVSDVCRMERQRVNSQWYQKNVFVARGAPAEVPCRFLPLYATPAAAGISVPIDGEDYDLIPADLNVPLNADFAVKIQGDSMEPWIFDGDIVYVDKDATISVGDIGIFCVDGAMYCKQFYVDEAGNLTLVSSNELRKKSNVHVLADGGSYIRCFGRVIMQKRVDLPDYFLRDQQTT